METAYTIKTWMGRKFSSLFSSMQNAACGGWTSDEEKILCFLYTPGSFHLYCNDKGETEICKTNIFPINTFWKWLTWGQTGWLAVLAGTQGAPWIAYEGNQFQNKLHLCDGGEKIWGYTHPCTWGSTAWPWPLLGYQTSLRMKAAKFKIRLFKADPGAAAFIRSSNTDSAPPIN